MAFLDTAIHPASHPASQRLAIPDSPSPQAKLQQPRGNHKKRHNAHHKQNCSSPAAAFFTHCSQVLQTAGLHISEKITSFALWTAREMSNAKNG
ncbi:MAG: hypothetical protein II691_00945 [Muribaculaceae bacterium]|nr:hypothetical protein [Muribaculaceae bacterium]